MDASDEQGRGNPKNRVVARDLRWRHHRRAECSRTQPATAVPLLARQPHTRHPRRWRRRACVVRLQRRRQRSARADLLSFGGGVSLNGSKRKIRSHPGTRPAFGRCRRGSRRSRAAPIHISGGHHFRQSGDDAGGSKSSRDMTARDIGISGGRQLGGGERSGDAGGSKGAREWRAHAMAGQLAALPMPGCSPDR